MDDQTRIARTDQDDQSPHPMARDVVPLPTSRPAPNQDIPDSSHDHSTLYMPAAHPGGQTMAPSRQPGPPQGSGGVIGTVAQDFGPAYESDVDAEYLIPDSEDLLWGKEMKEARGEKY